ncbi:MAG: ComEC/Rec2 family competence protein, partial [Candidatus Eisenbacteria bacterium]
IRERIVPRWREVFGPRVGAFAGWVLLGVRPDEAGAMREPFVRTGTAHLLAISGLHVGIVAGAVWAVLRILLGRPRVTRRMTAIVLVLYAFLTGGGVSVLRSCGMFLLLAFGPAWGRLGRGWNALGWAAALLPLVWPELPFRPSYVLSVGATTGVLLGARASAAWRPKPARRVGALVGTICASLGAQAGTFALGFGFFSVVSWTGLWFNLAAIPLAGVVVPLLLCAGLVALAPMVDASTPIVALARSLAETLLGLVDMASRHAVTSAGGLGERPALILSVAALVLLWAVARSGETAPDAPGVTSERRSQTRASRLFEIATRPWALGAFAICCGFVLPTVCVHSASAPPDGVRATFLDVGQGDAVLLEVGGETWLFDCGPPYPRRLVRALQRRGVTRLDRLFVTHGDQDHWGGYAAMLESSVAVDTVSISGGGPWPDRFWETLAAGGGRTGDARGAGIPPARPVVERIGAGWSRRWGELSVLALHPSPGFAAAGRNDHSIVLRVAHRNEGKVLLIGDLEEPGQMRLLNGPSCAPSGPSAAMLGPDSASSAPGKAPSGPRVAPPEPGPAPLDGIVVQAGHHGSGTSLAGGWYDAVRPGLVVASLAKDNRYGFPHPALLRRLTGLGIPFCRTDRDGSVSVTWRLEGWRVRRDRPGPPT